MFISDGMVPRQPLQWNCESNVGVVIMFPLIWSIVQLMALTRPHKKNY